LPPPWRIQGLSLSIIRGGFRDCPFQTPIGGIAGAALGAWCVVKREKLERK
jgi:hypothetical protein